MRMSGLIMTGALSLAALCSCGRSGIEQTLEAIIEKKTTDEKGLAETARPAETIPATTAASAGKEEQKIPAIELEPIRITPETETFSVAELDISIDLQEVSMPEIPRYELQNSIAELHLDAITVNEDSGAIVMDSKVLFAVNDSTISQSGKQYLDKLLDVYVETLFNDKYKDSIKEILLVGHADTTGSEADNQKLSEARAASVKEYCAQKKPELAPYLRSEGHGENEPLFDENGKEDKAASRRVELYTVFK